MEKFVVRPFISGMMGFSSFFTLIIAVKLLMSFFSEHSSFVIEIEDVYLSLIGFFLTFLIKMLSAFKGNEFFSTKKRIQKTV